MNIIQRIKKIRTRYKLFFLLTLLILSYYKYNEVEESYRVDMPINCCSGYSLYLGEHQTSVFNKIDDIGTTEDDDNLIITSYKESNYQIYYNLTFTSFFNRLEVMRLRINFNEANLLKEFMQCLYKTIAKTHDLEYYYNSPQDEIILCYSELKSDFSCYINLKKSPDINKNNIRIFFKKLNCSHKENKYNYAKKISKKEFFQLLEKYR